MEPIFIEKWAKRVPFFTVQCTSNLWGLSFPEKGNFHKVVSLILTTGGRVRLVPSWVAPLGRPYKVIQPLSLFVQYKITFLYHYLGYLLLDMLGVTFIRTSTNYQYSK